MKGEEVAKFLKEGFEEIYPNARKSAIFDGGNFGTTTIGFAIKEGLESISEALSKNYEIEILKYKFEMRKIDSQAREMIDELNSVL